MSFLEGAAAKDSGMTIDKTTDRTHESIINDALARLLRDRAGLDAVAETLRERRVLTCLLLPLHRHNVDLP